LAKLGREGRGDKKHSMQMEHLNHHELDLLNEMDEHLLEAETPDIKCIAKIFIAPFQLPFASSTNTVICL
jgi:hypothetical protein